MRDYIILNGVNSNTITGLLISTLPPITKPKIRTQTEEIDGRDGDIVTKLGYSAYDKEIEIGLYGDFDIDDVIAYFNSEGTVTFSNEPDKFYNYQILDQIDYEKLIRFKKAKVKMHVQPFKYPLEETPVEITNQYVNNEAEEMDLDNTKEAPMTIALKGNTSQESTTGKNLLNNTATTQTINGITYTINEDKSVSVKGTATANSVLNLSSNITLEAGSYIFSGCYPNGSWATYSMGFGSYNDSGSGASFTKTESYTAQPYIRVGNRTQIPNAITFYPMIRKSTESADYEPYTNGASPNPDYPQDVSVVSGDNNIEVFSKNLFNPQKVVSDSNNAKTFITSDNKWICFETGGTRLVYYPVGIKENTRYTLKMTVKNGTTSQAIGFSFFYTDGTSTTFSFGVISDTNEHTLTTTSENGKTISYIRSSWTVGKEAYIKIEGTQLEEGSQATEYQEYKGATYPISLGVLGKNLFNGKVEQGAIGSYDNRTYADSKTDSTTRIRTTDLIKLDPSKSYTISTKTGYSFAIFKFNDEKKSYGTATWQTTATTITNTPYIALAFKKTSEANITPSEINSLEVMLEVGTSASTYEKYNPLELCKIGDYQDRIYKDSDKWYIEKQIGKIVLDGTQGTVTTPSTNRFNIDNAITDYKRTTSDNLIYLSNQYKAYKQTGDNASFNTLVANESYGFNMTSGENVNNTRIKDIRYTTIADFKNWLSSNPLTIYYVLKTPTTTEITDETLIAQLNALANASSYDTVTHITQNANDKPFILNATALKQGSGEATVNNEGNIYSKPTLDIEGSGTIGIYLDGNQIFSIDLSNSSECVIDTTKLEAYNPTTSELMNRQVTGDYSNFKLNAGDNQVEATGDITKVTISNYTRWL